MTAEPTTQNGLLRSITFAILAIAIGGSLISNRNDVPKEPNQNLILSGLNLQIQNLVWQALSVNDANTDEERKLMKDLLIQQIQVFDREPSFRIPEIEVQRRILLDYIGEDISGFNDTDLGSYSRSFHLLYTENKRPADDDPIWKLPAIELAILQLEKRINSPNYESHLQNAKQSAIESQGRLSFGILLFFCVIVVGVYLGWQFLINRPPAYYGQLIKNLKAPTQPIFIESAILFLFVIFPVSSVITNSALQDVIKNHIFEYNLTLTICGFFLSVFYFKSEISSQTLGWMFWIPVIDQTVDNETIKKRSTVTAILKEILIGMAAWAAIFPVAMLVTLLTLSLLGNGSGGDATHPIVYYVKDNFELAFILAVVIVPIVEEVIFRNFVYGFFRFRFGLGFSAFASGLFFAILHPQGLMAVPALTVLGTGLAILREHRPSILAPIVTHMVVNGFTLTLMKVLL